MAFIDDDEEEDSVPQSATNYYFEDDDKEPVSFACLPIQWSHKEKVDGSAAGLYLRGTSDDGLLPLHKLVKAWRFDLSNFSPEISVLTKDNVWIKLVKPRKSYAELIRTVLVTVHALQFLGRNPQASDRSLWEHLSKIFKGYDVKPSQNDLVDHIDLIAEAVKRDGKLSKSKFIPAFLSKKPTKKRLLDEDNPKDDFIVEDDSAVASNEDELDDEEDDDDYFESVCAICDNGGELLCCEGSCLRSFHATRKDDVDSHCDSLGMTKMQVEAIQKYYCPNCEHKIHSCFICKKLGSSDNSNGAAEVFQCVSATCGYFYHPRCVSKRLHSGNKEEAEALERQIIAGEFTCPLHKCSVCKNGEVKTDPDLQFAVCRRCPKSYHRKCLPREISFEDIDDEDIFTRAWAGLLNNRVLIYCLEHEMDEELMTPVRDHVEFPMSEEEKRIKMLERERRKISAFKDLASRDRYGQASVKSFRSSFPSSKDGVSTKKHGLVSSVPDHLRKRKEVDPFRKSNLVRNKSQKTMEYGQSREAGKKKVEVNEAHDAEQSKVSLGEGLFNYMHDSNIVKSGRVVPVDSKHSKTDSFSSKESGSEIPKLDNDSQRRLLAIMKKAKEEITMDTILNKYKGPSTYRSSAMTVLSKTITMGKVEGSVQAVRTALKKLEEGGSIEDAKAVCEPEVLSQVFKWKDKFKVYLAPFLHGARYSSFGRHFTKPDKLQLIVDRLHWYAEDGDMIVDFCCGANDFSWLMKAKLEETGKKCSYKNYDLFQAKNDFCFEKRDWLTVCKEELPPGRRLIMGLNPPFGLNASLANAFVAKALEFLPKILILIVPPETDRLDKKRSSYVCVWEDEEIVSGKSFYLPGSVNNEDNQLEESWNVVSPPLSLWSHPDFAAKHRAIAEMHNHLPKDVGSLQLNKTDEEANASFHPLGASSDGICDDKSTSRDSPFENGENSRLENEDVPMEVDDELEVADCVNNILLSEKIETRETAAHVKHQSDHLSRRSHLEKERDNTRDYSGRMLGKRNEMEGDRRELNRRSESVEIPEMTSPVRSSSDDIYAVCTSISNVSPQRSHEPVEASLPSISRKKSNLGKDIREPESKVQGIRKPEEMRNRPTSSARSSREDSYTVRPSTANTSEKPYEAFERSYGASLSHFDDGLAVGGFAKSSLSRTRQFPGVVSSSSCSCGYSEILNFDFGSSRSWNHQGLRVQAMSATAQRKFSLSKGDADEKIEPDHLLVLVHGILASPSDWLYVEAEMKRRLGRRFLIYASSSNTFTKTFGGIDGAGKRLAEEVRQVIQKSKSLKKISFLAHSLGGLFARHAVAVLYSTAASDGAAVSNSGNSHLPRGLLAGLEPINFITLATPHLGVRGRKQLPFLLGVPILERLAAPLAPFVVGRTGSQLFLTDGKADKPPLLLRMASDCEDLKFLSSLGSFRSRIVYANVSYDHMVGWRTSSIRRETELFKPPRRSLDGYKHVVDVEYCPPVSSDGAHFPPEAAKAKEAAQSSPSPQNTLEYHEIVEDEMIRGLQTLGWKKVDVSFHSTFWPYLAHNNIHVKSERLYKAGAGVVAHVADSIKQQETSTFITASL